MGYDTYMVKKIYDKTELHPLVREMQKSEVPAWIKNRYYREGTQRLVFFDNGYGASIIRTPLSYGGDRGLFELAVLEGTPQKWFITYATSLTSDVIGHLTENEVEKYLKKISSLKRKNLPIIPVLFSHLSHLPRFFISLSRKIFQRTQKQIEKTIKKLEGEKIRRKISMEMEFELEKGNLCPPYMNTGKAIDIFKDKYGVRPTYIVLPKSYLRDFKRKFKEKYQGVKDLSFKDYRHYYFFGLKIIRGDKFALGNLK